MQSEGVCITVLQKQVRHAMSEFHPPKQALHAHPFVGLNASKSVSDDARLLAWPLMHLSCRSALADADMVQAVQCLHAQDRLHGTVQQGVRTQSFANPQPVEQRCVQLGTDAIEHQGVNASICKEAFTLLAADIASTHNSSTRNRSSAQSTSGLYRQATNPPVCTATCKDYKHCLCLPSCLALCVYATCPCCV